MARNILHLSRFVAQWEGFWEKLSVPQLNNQPNSAAFREFGVPSLYNSRIFFVMQAYAPE